jgi:hypothetical protein
MNTVLHHRTAMAIGMACDGGAFVHPGPWLSKWPAMEVLLFVVATSFV